MKNYILVLILIYSLCSKGESSLISSVGGIDTTSNSIIEWGIGETISGIIKFEDRVEIITQGFFQGEYSPESLNINSKITFDIFPKPAKDNLWINIKKEVKEKIKVSVYNIKGSLISISYHESNLIKIDLAQYNDGMFYLKIEDTSDGEYGADKFIVVK